MPTIQNPLGFPSSPHLRRQMPSRIEDYNGTTFSLYMSQIQKSLRLGMSKTFIDLKKALLQKHSTVYHSSQVYFWETEIPLLWD